MGSKDASWGFGAPGAGSTLYSDEKTAEKTPGCLGKSRVVLWCRKALSLGCPLDFPGGGWRTGQGRHAWRSGGICPVDALFLVSSGSIEMSSQESV